MIQSEGAAASRAAASASLGGKVAAALAASLSGREAPSADDEAAALGDDEEAPLEPTAAEGKGEQEVLKASTSFEEAEIRGALKKLACKTMREIVAATGKRTDGRAVDEVRPITIEMQSATRRYWSAKRALL